MDSWHHIRITAFDAAGNASQELDFVSEPESTEEGSEADGADDPEVTEGEKESGCSSLPGVELGLWSLLAILGLRPWSSQARRNC